MTAPSYASEPQIQYLTQVIEEIRQGLLLVPRFQRRSVWRPDQRIDLFRSIRKGIPIGSLLIWRTRLELVSENAFRLPAQSNGSDDGHLKQYLLDGLQRMSTLVSAVISDQRVENDDSDSTSWPIVFDLALDDFIFARDAEPDALLLPLYTVLDSVRLLRFQRGLPDRPDIELLIQRSDDVARALRSYKIAVVPIVTDDLDYATLTFQRINSQGTPMGEFDMVSALTWSDQFDLRDRMDGLRLRLEEIGWASLEDNYVLAACKAAADLDIYSKRVIDRLSERIKGDPELVDRTVEAICRAARLLSSLCHIQSPRMLPYSYQVVLIAEALRKVPSLTPEIERRLQQWFWWTTYLRMFAGISGYRLQLMLTYVRALVTEDQPSWPFRAGAVIDALPRRFDPRDARIKALALRLAELEPRGSSGEPYPAWDLLDEHGGAAMVRVAYGPNVSRELASSPATRLLADPRDTAAIRRGLKQGHLLGNRDWCQSHAISEDAAEAFRRGDLDRFLRCRLEIMEQLDHELLKRLGRPPGMAEAVGSGDSGYSE